MEILVPSQATRWHRKLPMKNLALPDVFQQHAITDSTEILVPADTNAKSG